MGHQIVFTSSYTDLGVCCKIFPQLDFDDPLTRNISVKDYKSLINNLDNMNWFDLLWHFSDKQFLNITAGAKNGQKNGLTLLLDVDSFEYSFYPRSAKGFVIGLSSTGEVSGDLNKYCNNKFSDNKNILKRPVVRQQGFYVKPGTSSLVSMKVSRTVTSPKALKYFDSDQRMCYTEQEFQPLYFNEVLSFEFN